MSAGIVCTLSDDIIMGYSKREKETEYGDRD